MTKQNRGRGFTLVELLVVIGIIALLISILLPSLNSARESANRVKCASNVSQVGRALLLYANENKGAFPRTQFTAGSAVVAAPDTNAGNTPRDPFKDDTTVNNVCKAIFLLIRTQDLSAEVFICPSSNNEKDVYTTTVGTAGTALNKVSFSSRNNLSYSIANPYPSTTAVTRGYKWVAGLSPEIAILADSNIGSANTNPGLANVTINSSQKDQQKANSANHQGRGQNVLYADGHAEWQQTTFCGAKRDCIFTNASDENMAPTSARPVPDKSVGRTAPGWSGDSVLIPCPSWNW